MITFVSFSSSDTFVHSLIPNKYDTTSVTKETSCPYVHAPLAQNPHNASLSRFEVFPYAHTFCHKPEPFYATQYSGFILHTLMVLTCIHDNQTLTVQSMKKLRKNSSRTILKMFSPHSMFRLTML